MSSPKARRFGLYIDGEWKRPQAASWIPNRNPATGETWAQYVDASDGDVGLAVAAARRALHHGDWPRLAGSARAHLLMELADALERNRERVGAAETRENGKLLREALAQVAFAARTYRFFAGLADKIVGESIPLDDPAVTDFTIREPVGVCALMTAWNSPMQLLANKLGPALAAGNVAVVKPSEHASASTLLFAELAHEVGIPPGVLNIITGRGATAGAALANHPDVDLISLTGSPLTGAAVATAAAQRAAPVVLELGGKSPNLVFADCSVDRAVAGVASGIFSAAGQSCIAGSRLIIDQRIYAEFTEKLIHRSRAIRVGDPIVPETEMGPVANEPQYKRVLGYIASAQEDGAHLLCGGQPLGQGTGLYVEPTVFEDPSAATRVAREEVFGPVLTVTQFESEDEAVALANGSEYGLAAGVWTQDIGRALRVARSLEVGSVWVNTYRTVAPAAPFGGVKRSGIGRERGLDGLREYTRVKNVMIDTSEGLAQGFQIRVA